MSLHFKADGDDLLVYDDNHRLLAEIKANGQRHTRSDQQWRIRYWDFMPPQYANDLEQAREMVTAYLVASKLEQ